ncbi:cytochrome P450 [Embleya sp. NPDC020630]|uniref:cytochrome P450 n=1 Tax=Embleya sp. NPDC020630 TaxID=3363979 RepID=UPI0037B44EA8
MTETAATFPTDETPTFPTGAGPDEAPAFPSDRTCPYRLPDTYNTLRDAPSSLRRVTLYDGRPAWVVTRYEAARKLLADPRLSSNRANPDFPLTSPRLYALRNRRPGFLALDPPEHGPRRRMTISEFTVRRIKGMRPDVERIVHAAIDDLIADGPPADLVTRLALPVPSMVICELLGVPYADHDLFQDASRRLLQAVDGPDAVAARDLLEDYLGGLIARLERDPGPGLLSHMVTEYVAKGALDRQELVDTAVLLLVAGHETTASMTSLGVITLLEHPEQHAALRADPTLIPGAVEELLRYLAIADIAGGRVAVADIEIDGQLIRAGDGVIVANSIVNRDGSVFEDPDTFDIRRSARHHLAFGYGIHQCLGQNLARLELEVIIAALFDRVPTLRLAIPVEDVKLRPGASIQGVNELTVTW